MTTATVAIQKYRIPRVACQLVREKTETTEVKKIRSPRDIANLIFPLIGNSDREIGGVLLLDTKNNVNAIHFASIGDLSSAIVHPREIFKAAVIAGSASIIFFHNHPSGEPTASPEDIATTKRLYEVGELLGIELLDSVIIGDEPGRFTSLKEKGLF